MNLHISFPSFARLFKAGLAVIFSAWIATCGFASEEKKAQINVATFNIRHSGDKGKTAWEVRAPNIKKIIDKYGFDIFGMQEPRAGQLQDLLKDNPAYAAVGEGRDGGVKGEFTPIMYKKDRFEVIDSGNFWLSEDTDKPNKGWDGACNRICTWAKMRDKAGGKEFYFFNTHFDHIGQKAREESAKLIVAKAKEIAPESSTIILTGDFNMNDKDSRIKGIIAEGTFSDSRAISKSGPKGTYGTFHGYKLDGKTKNRIDFIFVTKDVKVKSYETINDDIELKAFSSDHFPVFIKAEF